MSTLLTLLTFILYSYYAFAHSSRLVSSTPLRQLYPTNAAGRPFIQKDGTIIVGSTGWITFPFYFATNYLTSPSSLVLQQTSPSYIKSQHKLTIFKQISGRQTTVLLQGQKRKPCRVHDDCQWTQLCNMNECINVTSLRPCSGEHPCPAGWMCSRYDFCLSSPPLQPPTLLNYKQQDQSYTIPQYIAPSGGIERSVQRLLFNKQRVTSDGCTSNYDCRFAGPKNQKCNTITGKCVWCMSYSDCGPYHERCNLLTNLCGK